MHELIRRRPLVSAALGYSVLAVLVTWPLLPRLATALGGHEKDAIHALWSSWWWHDSLARGVSPLSDEGVRLSPGALPWLNRFSVPVAILAWPFGRHTSQAPSLIVYNTALLATLTAAGFSVFLLCREIWGGAWASFLAGALYAVGAYRTGLGIGRVELIALASSPLYLVALVHTVRRHGLLAPVLAGMALAVSACCSRAHLVFCAMATLVVLVMVLRSDRTSFLTPTLLRRVLLGGCVFAATGGWYALGPMLGGGVRGLGGDADRAAIDLTSFIVRVSGRAVGGGAPVGRVPSTDAAPYLGIVALIVAATAFVRVKAARPWLLLGCVGAVLALGTRLRVAGHAVPWLPLPLSWLGGGASLLRLATPAEFTWLVVLGLAVAIGAALATLVRARPRGPLAAAVVVAVALADIWPHAAVAEPMPTPRFLRDLAKDEERWAVLDLTGPQRQQWNQIFHQHAVLDASLIDRMPRRGDALARFNAARALGQNGVRFVIKGCADASLDWLELPVAFEGDGLVVLEVPLRVGRFASNQNSRQ